MNRNRIFSELTGYLQYIRQGLQIINKAMMHMRYCQRQEAKCNLCCNWFPLQTELKGCLNICEECIALALNTRCFKVPSASGTLYQLFLLKKHGKIEKFTDQSMETKNEVGSQIDRWVDKDIEFIIGLWGDVMAMIKTVEGQKIEKSREIIKNYQKQMEKVKENMKEKLIAQMKKAIDTKQEQAPQLTKRSIYNEKPQALTSKKQRPLKTPLKDSSLAALNVNINLDPSSASKQSRRRQNSKQTKDSTSNSGGMKRSIITGLQNSNSKAQNGSSCGVKVSGFSLLPGKKITSLFASGSERQLENSDFKMRSQFNIKTQSKKSSISAYLQSQTNLPAVLNRIMTDKIHDALLSTSHLNGCLQLVSYPISDINIHCYLSHLDFTSVQTFKLIKVGLTDEQFSILMDYVKDKVEVVVVTNNCLTQAALEVIKQGKIGRIKSIYMGNNMMVGMKVRNVANQVKDKLDLYL